MTNILIKSIYNSIYGNLQIVVKENKIVFLGKVDCPKIVGEDDDFVKKIKSQLDEYFAGKRTVFSIDYMLKGTDFQLKVWDALSKIPYGETRSYKEVATKVGNPKAARAIGMANNKNPISIIIPCHRVIGSNKKLTGYAGGLDMKKGLLELEQKNK